MTRVRVGLLVSVALGVWALALLRGSPEAAPSPVAVEQEHPPLPQSTESATPAAKPTPREPAAQEPPKPAAPPPQQHDPRYLEASQRWQEQGRMEPWASRREQTLRAALKTDHLEHLVIATECRANLCRLEISAPDTDTAMAFRSSVAFVQEAGPATVGGLVGSGADRALIIFVPREAEK